MFETLDYLRHGNKRQQRALIVIEQNSLFTILAPYDPLLAGTIPINIDIETSDLDILCCWKNRVGFLDDVSEYFSHQKNFQLKTADIRGRESVIASFSLEEFEIEIFGQNIPSRDQDAFRHMLMNTGYCLNTGKNSVRRLSG